MIYICIPSHNEERTVGVLLWKIRQVLTAFPRDYQLLVLDDASDDRTGEVLAPYARILPLTVLRHAQRKGYSASLDELLREAVRRSEYPRRDVVLTLQADFTEEPDDIPALLKRIESGADIVTTRVRISPEHAPRKLRWMRAVMSRALRRLDWPENVTDVLSGLRAYRVIGLRKALEEREGARLLEWQDTWAANAALLRAVKPYVRRIDEVEIELRPDRRQRDSRFDGWSTARQLLRLAFGGRSAVPVPPRGSGAAIVPASELALATRGPAHDAESHRRDRGRGERPDRGDRGDAVHSTATTSRRGTRGASAAGEAPARRGGRAEGVERPQRAEKGERGARPEQGERREKQQKAPRGDRAEHSERSARGKPREARLEPQEAAAPDGAAPARSRPRRKRGGAAAAAAASETVMPAAASDGGGALTQGVAEGDATAAVENVAATEGGARAVPSERKRRRPSRRRSRAAREAAAAAEGTVPGAQPPDAAPAPAAEPGSGADGGEQLELGSGSAPGEGEPGAPAGSRPRRRSRRGGRGRSRVRRAEAGQADQAGAPEPGPAAEPAEPARPGGGWGGGAVETPAGGPDDWHTERMSTGGAFERPASAPEAQRGGDAAPSSGSAPEPAQPRPWPPAGWERDSGSSGPSGVDATGERGEATRPPAAPTGPLPHSPAGGDADTQ